MVAALLHVCVVVNKLSMKFDVFICQPIVYSHLIYNGIYRYYHSYGKVSASQRYTPTRWFFTGYTVVCYTTNWGQYRSAPYTFTTDHIEASLCTHIIHSFIQITNGVLDFYESNDESKCCIVFFCKSFFCSLAIFVAAEPCRLTVELPEIFMMAYMYSAPS